MAFGYLCRKKMARENFGFWLFMIASLLLFLKAQCINVGITYVQEAGAKGAGKKLEYLDRPECLIW